MANPLRWQAGLILLAQGAAAQDCGADAFQRAVCALPEARAAWAQMEADLAAVQGPARPAILATHDRWLAMMGRWDPEATRAEMAGVDRSFALQTFAEDHGWRPKDSTDAEIVRQIERQGEDLAALQQDWQSFETLKSALPGVQVTLATGCDYTPDEAMPNGSSLLYCGGSIRMQLGDRVCSVLSYSYGDRFNHVFSVDQVVAGALVHRGNCDDNGSGPVCPDPDWDDPDAHWNSDISEDVSDMRAELQTPNTGVLATNDPEVWHMLGLSPPDWFQTCLTSRDYPPEELTWAGAGPAP